MFSATPGAGIALDRDRRLLVHAAAVIADMPVDLDRDRRIHPGGDGMRALAG